MTRADLRAAMIASLRDPRFRLRFEVGLAVALTVGLVLSIVLLLGVFTPLDSLLNDLVYQPMQPTGQVVIIAIDKKSLDQFGPWPWPRTVHAGLLERLSTAPPRVIALDLLFSQAAPEDLGLAAAITRQGNVELTTVGVQAAAYPQRPTTFPQFDVLLLPSVALRNTPVIGHRMIVPDPDGVVRRVSVAIGSSDTLYPALGLTLAQSYLGNPPLNYDLPNHQVLLGSLRIPVDEYGHMLINFTNLRDGIPTYSYIDVFNGTVPASTFANKIVLVGGTTSSEPETYATPLTSGNNIAYNVVLQADLADMLIQNPPRILRQQGSLDQIAVTLLFALMAGLTLPHMRPLSAAALTIIYLLSLLLFAFDAFGEGLIIRVVFPALGLVLSFGAIATFRYLSEERRRQFLTTLFRRYVPAESVSTVVDAIDRGELPLKGARRIVTVLYCDLRGFSALSEGLAPEAVLGIMNRYLELMMIEIHTEAGTINKPMGDALVAIWNAPLDQPDHASRAVRAAINIRRDVLRVHTKEGEEEHSLNIGLGLATGWAILGNMNVMGKVEYTLIGETVNVAQRISAFAGGNQILADTLTSESLPDTVERRELSPVRIRGRKEPLAIWELKDT
ncbi:MAG: adenylate/guanylate cyclase domain-containing protein, partial [Anaerolineae bacterium]